MGKMVLRIFNKSETKHFDFRLINMDGYREAMKFLANNDISFVLHGGEEEDGNQDNNR